MYILIGFSVQREAMLVYRKDSGKGDRDQGEGGGDTGQQLPLPYQHTMMT